MTRSSLSNRDAGAILLCRHPKRAGKMCPKSRHFCRDVTREEMGGYSTIGQFPRVDEFYSSIRKILRVPGRQRQVVNKGGRCNQRIGEAARPFAQQHAAPLRDRKVDWKHAPVEGRLNLYLVPLIEQLGEGGISAPRGQDPIFDFHHADRADEKFLPGNSKLPGCDVRVAALLLAQFRDNVRIEEESHLRKVYFADGIRVSWKLDLEFGKLLITKRFQQGRW